MEPEAQAQVVGLSGGQVREPKSSEANAGCKPKELRRTSIDGAA